MRVRFRWSSGDSVHWERRTIVPKHVGKPLGSHCSAVKACVVVWFLIPIGGTPVVVSDI